MVTDEALESVAENLKHLRRLNIEHCFVLTSASLQSLAHHRVATLEALWLSRSRYFTSEAVFILKSQIPSLGVHFQWSLDSDTLTPTVCTVLTIFDLVHFLPIAAQFQALTILCCHCILEKNCATMTEILHRLPSLHTVVTFKCNLLPL